MSEREKNSIPLSFQMETVRCVLEVVVKFRTSHENLEVTWLACVKRVKLTWV